MTDTNVFQLVQPGTFSARLTEVWRDGARAFGMISAETLTAGRQYRLSPLPEDDQRRSLRDRFRQD